MPLKNEHSGYTNDVRGVNLNAVGDTAIKVPFAKYVVRRVTVTNASADMTGSSCTVGMYTAPAAGGTAIVTPAVVTSLTAPAKLNDRTIAASADAQTAATLYVRVGVAHGAAATADVYVELQSLE